MKKGVKNFLVLLTVSIAGLTIFFVIVWNLPSTKEQRAYRKAFNSETMTVFETSDMIYSEQRNLKRYDIEGKNAGRKWDDLYIPLEYKSNVPNDVGGIITCIPLLDDKMIAGKYGTKGDVYAYYVDYELKIYDPYTGEVICEEMIKCDSVVPEKITSTGHHKYLYPKSETVENRIKIVWGEYLQVRN
ncbi:MAG: hypothetical protein FWG31_00560 [Oscillospiraceae bacterium]|nr:hypothetical protein [Oscillospiraceae bacterium]